MYMHMLRCTWKLLLPKNMVASRHRSGMSVPQAMLLMMAAMPLMTMVLTLPSQSPAELSPETHEAQQRLARISSDQLSARTEDSLYDILDHSGTCPILYLD